MQLTGDRDLGGRDVRPPRRQDNEVSVRPASGDGAAGLRCSGPPLDLRKSAGLRLRRRRTLPTCWELAAATEDPKDGSEWRGTEGEEPLAWVARAVAGGDPLPPDKWARPLSDHLGYLSERGPH
ncbi:hypothetical protein NDU88_000072 [Pleurodeles waltl]|uniref:Uncharacterized protein n=1 Tax=Pleurodeles waltl TaxID=8319 RepID=A0AAV7V6I7_PLEWA|nr:hypothetical protein NDU88_000072 [Pleurodeles waltl]